MTKEEMLKVKDSLTKEEVSDILDELLEQEEASKIEKWRVDNCFNEDWVTYVYFPADSYLVKEDLKRDMFHYHPILKWHIADVPMEYEDKVIPVKLSHLGEMRSYGKVEFYADAKRLIEERCAAARPEPAGEWIGEKGKKLSNHIVRLTDIGEFNGIYGTTDIYRFVDNDKNLLEWFTTSSPKLEEGKEYKMSATIKDHKIRNGYKVTYVSRCKFTE